MKKTFKTMINNFFYVTGAAIIAFFMPIFGIIGCIFAIVILDTALGIWSALKEKEKITSTKLWNIVPKFAVYFNFVIVVYLLDLFLLCDIVAIHFSVPMLTTKLASLIPIIIELKSIDENVKRIWDIDIISLIKKCFVFSKSLKKK